MAEAAGGFDPFGINVGGEVAAVDVERRPRGARTLIRAGGARRGRGASRPVRLSMRRSWRRLSTASAVSAAATPLAAYAPSGGREAGDRDAAGPSTCTIPCCSTATAWSDHRCLPGSERRRGGSDRRPGRGWRRGYRCSQYAARGQPHRGTRRGARGPTRNAVAMAPTTRQARYRSRGRPAELWPVAGAHEVRWRRCRAKRRLPP